MQDLIEEIGAIISLSTLLNYLVRAWKWSNSIPYRFKMTRDLISPSTKVLLSTALRHSLQFRLDQLIFKHVDLLRRNEHHHWLDDVLSAMVSYWDPVEKEGRRPALAWGIIEYLNTGRCVDAVGTTVNSLPEDAWKCISETIHAGPTISRELAGRLPNNAEDVLAESLTAVWTILFQSPPWRKLHIDLLTLEAVLEAVSQN
jgi:hypothetical protein